MITPPPARCSYSTISVNPDRLDVALVPLFVGKLSSAVWFVVGVPADVASLAIRIDRGSGNAAFTAAAIKTAPGVFRCYLSPFYFPDVAATTYHVMGEDDSGNPRWLGSGSLSVLDCPSDGSSVTPDVLPKEAYAYNPVTGLYHKLVAEVDDAGVITVAVDQEGVSR